MNCAHFAWPENTEAFRQFFQLAETARVPLSGTLELTRRCNLRCVHCYLSPRERRGYGDRHEMSTAQVLNVIDQLVSAGCLSLVLTGGDPLMRLDFAKIYRHSKLAGLDVALFTNGTLLSDELVDLFRDLPPRVVEISIYGSTTSAHEQVTGVPGSWAAALAGARKLCEAGVRLCLKTMLMRVNQHELEGMEALAQDLGAKFRFDPVINARLDGGREPLAFRLDPSVAVQLEFARPWLRQGWADLHAQYPVVPQSDLLFQCGAGQTAFHVDAFGNLQPCLMVPWISHSPIDVPFAEAWAQVGVVLDTRARADRPCFTCQLRPYCAYCPGFLALENGDPQTPSSYLCALGTERLKAIRLLSKEDV